MRPSGAILALVTVVTLIHAEPAHARAGELDATFGAAGISVLDTGGEDSGRAVAVDAAGRVVVAGEMSLSDPSRPGATAAGVARFNDDGSPDESFGDGGIALTDPGLFTAGFEAVMVDSAGRILAVGTAVGFDGIGADVVVARYLEDGTPDPSFGAGGVATIGDDGFWIARDAVIDRGGGILIAAMRDGSGGLRPYGIRLLEDGSVDPLFNGGGEPHFARKRLASISAIAALPTGGFLLAGSTVGRRMTVARFRSGGAIDFRYGPEADIGRTGMREVELRGPSSAEDIVLDARGRQIVVGSCECSTGRIAIARLNRHGTLDRSFSRGGRMTIRLGGRGATSEATSVTLDSSGGIVIGATVDLLGPDQRSSVIRLTPPGRLDRGFSAGGISSPGLRSLEDVTIDDTGRLLAAGSVFGATTDLAVARLQR